MPLDSPKVRSTVLTFVHLFPLNTVLCIDGSDDEDDDSYEQEDEEDDDDDEDQEETSQRRSLVARKLSQMAEQMDYQKNERTDG